MSNGLGMYKKLKRECMSYQEDMRFWGHLSLMLKQKQRETEPLLKPIYGQKLQRNKNQVSLITTNFK